MNLLFRLFIVLISSRRFKPIGPFDESSMNFFVMPTDLDVLGHMNNGKYFSLMDLGRVDFLIKTGYWAKLSERNWYPVVISETMRFKKSLQLFNRFQIKTKAIGWDEQYFYIEQKFVQRDIPYALGIIKARFLNKSGGSVTPMELMATIGYDEKSPVIPEYVKQWKLAEKAQMQECKEFNYGA